MAHDLGSIRDDLRAARRSLDDAQERLVAAEAALSAADTSQPDLLSIAEASRRLSVHRNTVLVMMKDGRLDGVLIGKRRHKVTRASVERLAGQIAKSVPKP